MGMEWHESELLNDCKIGGDDMNIFVRSVVLGVVKVMGAEEKLNFEFNKPENSHTQFLPWNSPPQIPHVVHLLVAQDLCYYVCSGDSLCSLGSFELAEPLADGIGIVDVGSGIGDVVVADKVNLHVVEKL